MLNVCCSRFSSLEENPDYFYLSRDLAQGNPDVGIHVRKGLKKGFRKGALISIPPDAIHTCEEKYGQRMFIEFKTDTPYRILNIAYHPSLDIFLYELAPNGKKFYYYFVEDVFEVYNPVVRIYH